MCFDVVGSVKKACFLISVVYFGFIDIILRDFRIKKKTHMYTGYNLKKATEFTKVTVQI